jgi:hypothetical protein
LLFGSGCLTPPDSDQVRTQQPILQASVLHTRFIDLRKPKE